MAGETALVLRISRAGQPIDACGRIGGEVAEAAGVPAAADPALYEFATARWYDTPGTYFWQVSRTAPDGTCAAAPARTLTVSAAAALPRLSRVALPRRIGSSNDATYVIRTGGVPGVGRALTLPVARAQHRPPLAAALDRHRAGPPGVRQRALGGRLLDAARAVGGARRHRHRADFRAGSAGEVERDLILRADLPWQPGPAYPDRLQIDLETVLLHEFGHFAGNHRHVGRGCRDTPMIIGLARGEWWRSPGSFSFRGCPSGAR